MSALQRRGLLLTVSRAPTPAKILKCERCSRRVVLAKPTAFSRLHRLRASLRKETMTDRLLPTPTLPTSDEQLGRNPAVRFRACRMESGSRRRTIRFGSIVPGETADLIPASGAVEDSVASPGRQDRPRQNRLMAQASCSTMAKGAPRLRRKILTARCELVPRARGRACRPA